jgi:adenosylhomocysteine nucleosidase
MEKALLGVVAAMPQEIKPLLRRVREYRKTREGGFNLYRFELKGVTVALIESGMGPAQAAQATRTLISLAAPPVILNFGFAGGVLPDLEVGDLVLAERVLWLERGVLTEVTGPGTPRGAALFESCSSPSLCVKGGVFITAATIMNKRDVAASLGGNVPRAVLEMETAAVLEAAAAHGVPVVALRGVSDAAGEELGFSLEEFCDDRLRLSVPRVIGCLLRKPWIAPQLARLARNSRLTGERLAEGVERALEALAARSGNPKTRP